MRMSFWLIVPVALALLVGFIALRHRTRPRDQVAADSTTQVAALRALPEPAAADAAAADAAGHSRHGAGAAPAAASPSATDGALKTAGSGSAGPGTEGSPDAASAAGVRAALPPIAPPMTASQVIQVLDQTVDWYRTLGLQQQAANEPSDMLFFYDNRQTASKVMSLAFDIARANADLLSEE
jgi:hypothetical protein